MLNEFDISFRLSFARRFNIIPFVRRLDAGAVCYVNPNYKKISNDKKRHNYGCRRRRWFAGREPWPTLHFYSNYAGRLVLGAGYHDLFNTETYPLESIKEFEAISTAWKQHLAELLKKGYKSVPMVLVVGWKKKHLDYFTTD